MVLLLGVSDQVETSTIGFSLDVRYRARVTNEQLGVVMFGKAFVLACWAGYKEAREAKLFERAWAELLLRFQQEWDKRRAKQPLLLTYRVSDGSGGSGTVEQASIDNPLPSLGAAASEQGGKS